MPTLLWKGTSYKIEAVTLGGAKRSARLREELKVADPDRGIEIVAELLGIMGCPQEVADGCPIPELMDLMGALLSAHEVATGGGGTGNVRPTEGVESSQS